jgi:phenylpyruvate tautomerase PptA (4-oxalocrotonate tautomerase family)
MMSLNSPRGGANTNILPFTNERRNRAGARWGAGQKRGDREVITEHDASGLLYDPSYLGVARSDAIIFIQITLNAGRTLAIKKGLYQRIAELLQELGVRKEDVFVSLVEVPKENWSFGNGVAQYAE